MSMWIAGASLAAGIGGSLISANGAKQSAQLAADTNKQNIQDTNAANLNLFNLSRGAVNPATGFGSSILPQYFGGNEQAAGQQAYDQFSQLNGLAQGNYNALSAQQGNLSGAINASTTALGNRFNGNYLSQQQQYSSPYYQANLNNAGVQGTGLRQVAAANSSAINTGLAQALSQINAQRAAQGFLGSSTYDRNRLASSTIGARQAAAVNNAGAVAQSNNLMAGAQLGNAGDARTLQMTNLDYMSNPANLSNGMSALTSFQNSPAAALSQMYSQAQTPLNFFRIQPQATQQQNLPTVTPQINNDQIYGSLLSQLGSAGSNYLSMNQMAQQYGGGNANPYTSAAAQSSLANSYQPSVNFGSGFGAMPSGPSTGFNYQMGGVNPSLYYRPPTG